MLFSRSYNEILTELTGIAEMAELEPAVRDITDALDALGNTTAATGKGFAIGSAVLTALSLLAAFAQQAGVVQTDIRDPVVLSGILIGAMLPFLFAALSMLSVQKVCLSVLDSIVATMNLILASVSHFFLSRPLVPSSLKFVGNSLKFQGCVKVPPKQIRINVLLFRHRALLKK